MKGSIEKQKEKFNLARLKKNGYNFEIVVDPNVAVDFKKGKLDDVSSALKSEHIFHDAKKGELASESQMKETFGTVDVAIVASKIIKEGEIQLTSEHREKQREEKINRIVDIIHRNGVDPRTGGPHTRTRIENAIAESKVRIDDTKSAEDQVRDILSSIRPILPIKFEVKHVEIILGANYASRIHGSIAKFGQLTSNEWQNDGSWRGVVKIPAGLEPDLYDMLNNITHGDVTTKVLKIE